MKRIAGGVAGWVAALLPLLGVNIAGYANVLDTQTAVIAGAAALAGGIILGGLVSGLVAGRPTPTRSGGMSGALPAGLVAAGLYAASLIVLVVVAIRMDVAPPVVAEHYFRITGAIIFLGALMLGVSLLMGMLAGRRAGQGALQAQSGQSGQVPPRGSAPQAMGRPYVPSRPSYISHSSNPGQATRSANRVDERRDYGYRDRDRDEYAGHDRRSGPREASGQGRNYGSAHDR